MNARTVCFRCNERPVAIRSWCRPCANEYGRAWRLRHLEEERQKARARYAAHPERWRETTRRWREAHVEQRREQHRRQYLKRRGLTSEQVDALILEHNGRCALCGRLSGALVIDHDHAHGHADQYGCAACVRGLLCRTCNTALGWFENRRPAVEAYLLRRPLS